MHYPSEQLELDLEAEPPSPADEASALPACELVFPERHDDPEQAEELERQQDA
jgi:hypothetical protein